MYKSNLVFAGQGLLQEAVISPPVVAHSRVPIRQNFGSIATHSGSKHVANWMMHKAFEHPHVGVTEPVRQGTPTKQRVQGQDIQPSRIHATETDERLLSRTHVGRMTKTRRVTAEEDQVFDGDDILQAMQTTANHDFLEDNDINNANANAEYGSYSEEYYEEDVEETIDEHSIQNDEPVQNINHQPKSEVNHIAEWIKHTWHYTNPINFKYVKEAIARGVCLRRTALWRKIELKESKPDDVSDHTWRALTLELNSAVTQKQARDCSKANASRQNFGRTGPTGEVGVVNSLTSKFKRPQHPHEIRMEMARDKGYRGRSKKGKFVDRIMHGSGEPSALSLDTEYLENQGGDVDLGVQEIGITPEVTDVSRSVLDQGHRTNEEFAFNGQKALSAADNDVVTMSVALQLMKRMADRMADFERALKDIAPG